MNKLAESFLTEIQKLGFVLNMPTRAGAVPVTRRRPAGPAPTAGTMQRKSQAAGVTPVNVSTSESPTATLPGKSSAPAS